MPRLDIGLIGLGRPGRVYARDLAGRIPDTRLVAVADTGGTLARDVAAEFEVPRSYTDPMALLDDPGVDAVVIVSPTHAHREQVLAAASRKKPTFCEKPPALSLAEGASMKQAIERTGMFFQMGFMRRFDAGYAAAKRRIDAGRRPTTLATGSCGSPSRAVVSPAASLAASADDAVRGSIPAESRREGIGVPLTGHAAHSAYRLLFERARIAERVKAGLARVRAAGRRLGRPSATLHPPDLASTAHLSVRRPQRRSVGRSRCCTAPEWRAHPPHTLVPSHYGVSGDWRFAARPSRSATS